MLSCSWRLLTWLARGWQGRFCHQLTCGSPPTCIPSLEDPRSFPERGVPLPKPAVVHCNKSAPLLRTQNSDDASGALVTGETVQTKLSPGGSSRDLDRKTRHAIDFSLRNHQDHCHPHLLWIRCASSDVPHRSAPSSPSTSHGAFSRRKMCFRTFGGSQVMLSRSTELIVNETSSS